VEYMHPVLAPLVPQIGLALGDFIGVVGEGVVDAAAVDIQILTQVFHGDAGALNVPAGVAYAPGGVPLEVLVLSLVLSEADVAVVPFALDCVVINARTDAYIQIQDVVVIENIVPLQIDEVEVNMTDDLKGVDVVEQVGDELVMNVDAAAGV